MSPQQPHKTPAKKCGDYGHIAKNHRGPCGAYAIRGSTACHYHGGKTPSGMASPHYKTGRFAKALPFRMQEAATEAAKDPELLALNESIIVTDARILDLLKRVDTGESHALWLKLRECWQDFVDARDAGDTARMGRGLIAIEQAINRGLADYAAWQDVGKHIDRRRQLVETEHKHRIAREELLSVERVNLLVGLIVETVNRRITEAVEAGLARTLRANISSDLRALTIPEA